jgi:tripartite-type tricarboxylate transporter receptor subunit TctC
MMYELNRRKMLVALTGAVAALSLPIAGYAQNYPTKLVRIIAPFAPGGGTDFIARVTAQKLTEALGQQFIVDNRPGAGGTLGAELGTRAPGRLYLYFGSPAATLLIRAHKIAFDLERVTRLSTLCKVRSYPGASVVAGQATEIDRAGQSKPGDLLYASSGSNRTSLPSFAVWPESK